ncbi:MAG: hypothetical protein AABY07_09020, partial [Nanoarchaeota archaeon]
RHLFDCYPEGWKGWWPRTEASFERKEQCPETYLCTTGASDTFGMAYDEDALAKSGYLPNWHQHKIDEEVTKENNS